MSARLVIGDVFDVMRTLPDQSVDLILTSPPFLALRSYLPADHPDKAKEIGSEPTPGAFIDTLLALTEEWARVLAPHGSLCVELGDTYSGSGGGGGDYLEGGLREGQPGFGGSAARQREGNAAHWRAKNRERDGWPEAKSLCLIPELYRVALVYGFNPLTGRQTPRWRARNVVRWCRPNPPVGALGDKFRPATSEMVVACKSARRWFDLDAVRNRDSDMTPGGSANSRQASGDDRGQGEASRRAVVGPMPNPAGAPPLDHWLISTQPYNGAHYATWPDELCVRPIEAMCPRQVCRVCGKPRERIVEPTAEYAARPNAGRDFLGGDHDRGKGLSAEAPYRPGSDPSRNGASFNTLGWTDCGHDDYRPGLVLDPFAGSGTTLAVTTGHGRDAIGIDLDERNADLARERVGMFLEVEYHDREGVA